MAFLDIPSVCIDGISVCVPRSRRTYTDLSHLMSVSEYSNFARVIGIEEVRLSDGGITTSDLCFKAASVLMDDLSINREEIDLLLFVS